MRISSGLRIAAPALVILTCWGCDSNQSERADTTVVQVSVEVDVCAGDACFVTEVPGATLKVTDPAGKEVFTGETRSSGHLDMRLADGQVCIVAKLGRSVTPPSCFALDGSPYTVSLRFTALAQMS
jgi:hypothetical protein